MVPWIRGTLKKFFLASSTPLAMAAGTSLALPYPTPTVPSPSPTTTRAVKLNRRPPLTTLATRLMATTRSTYGVLSAASPRRPRRSLPPALPPRREGALLICVFSLPRWSLLEVQSGFAGAVSQSRHTSGVAVTPAVEHDGVNTSGLGALGYQ